MPGNILERRSVDSKISVFHILILKCLLNKKRDNSVKYMSLEFRGEMWAGNGNTEIVNTDSIFRAMGLDEITKR